jgi:hypothetical protein
VGLEDNMELVFIVQGLITLRTTWVSYQFLVDIEGPSSLYVEASSNQPLLF